LKRSPVVLSAVALSVLLGGCSSNLFTEGKVQSFKFFAKSDWGSSSAASEESFSTTAVVPAEELIDPSGACAAMAVAAAPAPAVAPAEDGAPPAVAPAPAPAPILGGIALGMTECQVVQRAGQPGNIQIGADPNNDRSAVLTYMAGPWPGIYKFSAGRLKEVERVAMPEPPKPVKPVKKKRAAPKTASL